MRSVHDDVEITIDKLVTSEVVQIYLDSVGADTTFSFCSFCMLGWCAKAIDFSADAPKSSGCAERTKEWGNPLLTSLPDLYRQRVESDVDGLRLKRAAAT